MVKFESTNTTETKKRKRKNKGIISFEEEIVKKENAVEILQSKATNGESHLDSRSNKQEKQTDGNSNLESNVIQSINSTTERKQKKKSKKKNKKESGVQNEIEHDTQVHQDCDTESAIQTNDSVTEKKKKKKSKKRELHEESEVTIEDTESKSKKRKKSDEVEESDKIEECEESDPEVLQGKLEKAKGPSKRSLKKLKHAKLIKDKKLKSEVASQQGALNYLSKWKHCRGEWKFEKLKQIWLSQNLLDCSKIPNEFWDTVVEYFNGSRGFIKKLVLRDALKVIENEDNMDGDDVDEEQKTKLQRARDIIQQLQD